MYKVLTFFYFLLIITQSFAQQRELLLKGTAVEATPTFHKTGKLKSHHDFEFRAVKSVLIEVYHEQKLISSKRSDAAGNYAVSFLMQSGKNYSIKFSRTGLYETSFDFYAKDLKAGNKIRLENKKIELFTKAKGVNGDFFKRGFQHYHYNVKKDNFTAYEKYNEQLDNKARFLKQIELKNLAGTLTFDVVVDKQNNYNNHVKYIKESNVILIEARKEADRIIDRAEKKANAIIVATEDELQKESKRVIKKTKKEAEDLMEVAEDEAFGKNDKLKKHVKAAKKREQKRVIDSLLFVLAEKKHSSNVDELKPSIRNNDPHFNDKQAYIASKKSELLNKKRRLEIDRLKAINHDDSLQMHESELSIMKIENEIHLVESQVAAAQQEIHLKDELVSKQRVAILVGSLALLIALAFAIMMFININEKKKTNALLEVRNSEIDKKNKHIFSSLEYAKRIQNAILPSNDTIKEHLPNSFFLYHPKDIVSGDFYWLQKTGDKILYAAVDCTGHGVPGAFMSIVGNNALNKAVKERGLDRPSEILENVNSHLQDVLRQNNTDNIQDGMDLALCSLDLRKMKLEYSGAYNPLWIVRDNELLEIKADKQPLGPVMDNIPDPFTNHHIELKKDDVLYIFTDGYVDQFGGSKGLKFMRKRFKEFLITIHKEEISKQKELLLSNFYEWKGNHEQIDDICVIGLKI